MSAPFQLPESDALRQHSYQKAMHSASRLFSGCDTKWPEFYLEIGINHLIDDLLQCALHLRRMSEFSNKKIVRKIEPHELGVPRSFAGFESDLWNAVNRIIHHHTLTAVTFALPDFYRTGNAMMPGYLLADVRVKSDRGVSLVNVAGFAIAATNELGALALKPQKVFH